MINGFGRVPSRRTPRLALCPCITHVCHPRVTPSPLRHPHSPCAMEPARLLLSILGSWGRARRAAAQDTG